MRLHHLNCATLHPPGGTMVCHVLMLEVDARLVLVDTGIGTADVRDPRRLGPVRHVIAPVLREDETAVAQLRARGLGPEDVSDIVLTHGDLDHAGGIGDFPAARIHLTAAEHAAVLRRRGPRASLRYRRAHWAHRPHVVGHPPGDGRWHSLTGVVELAEVAPGLLLVPLPGHTAGHAGVAVPVEDGWLLHAGDAAHSAASLRRGGTRADVHLRQALLAHDPSALRRTQRALAQLADDESIRILTAHDPDTGEPPRGLRGS